ncbi:MAG: hypothetical protein JWP08_1556 [Bryobacterales bacterium]|nr:hypothetical protein [Bryobacterales bacterium]
MAATDIVAVPIRDGGVTETAANIPWYIWCAVLAVTSAMVGAHWDISWHSSIGRDTFWTPAHMAIYLCGVLAGVAFGYLILHTTFSKRSPLAASSVHIWGFRGPLGAFIASWGGITMLTSAPFDNWWHDAYGLDVKIVSPPHIVLFLGTYGVLAGTLVLIAGHANRSNGKARESAQRLFLYVTGVTLVMMMVLIMEYTGNSMLHRSLPYALVSLLAPIALAIGSGATGIKYAATAVAAIYMLCLIGFILILPLFPAQPKLGPVYQNVTHFIPPQFPLLLVAPALALDLVWQRTRHWNWLAVSVISAAVFTGVLLAVEWPFADFLMSPASRNRFFGTNYFWYRLPPTSFSARHLFYLPDTGWALWRGIGVAMLFAIASISFGLWRGSWMEKVKR